MKGLDSLRMTRLWSSSACDDSGMPDGRLADTHDTSEDIRLLNARGSTEDTVIGAGELLVVVFVVTSLTNC